MPKVLHGGEVRFFKWNVSTHDVYRAILRSVPSTSHGTVDLSYYNATGINQNSVKNLEEFATLSGNDYWRHAFRVDPSPYPSLPYVNPRPEEGDCVWFFEWISAASEHQAHPAIVRNVALGTTPQISIFYILDDGTRQNVNAVESFLDLTDPIEEHFWVFRRLIGE